MSAMAINKSDTILFTGDSFGFVYVWRVEHYCSEEEEKEPPECMSYKEYEFHARITVLILFIFSRRAFFKISLAVNFLQNNDIFLYLVITTWRGHIESITSITLIEDQKMLLSSSLDCTVRLWTFDGEYIGMYQNCIILICFKKV